MNLLASRLLLLLAVLLAGCATQTSPRPDTTEATRPTPLLLISIDGFRADYIDRGLSPTLAALAANGVRARAMQPSFPSLTFPNHYTLVTGLYPDHHGIVNNTMYDSTLGRFSLGRRAAVSDGRWWAEGEPLWVTADKAGLQTATMFWPGSEAEIHGYRPDHWLPFEGSMSPDARVDQLLEWMDLRGARRPAFMTLYFDDVDHAGHVHGPDSPEVNASIRTVDRALSRLFDELRRRGQFDTTNIIVVSDHGMAYVAPEHTILMDKVIDLDKVHVVAMGILAGFNLKPEYAATAREKLLATHPHMRCWDRQGIPARFHYGNNPRVPEISCLADTGWRISSSSYMAARNAPPGLGEHGYDNSDPRMRAMFIAHGPAFRRGVLVDEFPNVDVYPLMTHLLGIPAQPNDGDFTAVEGMLRETVQ